MMKRPFFFFLLGILVCTTFVVQPWHARAEESLALTVTPPLFQLNITPGESWSSAIKVVNTNTSDLIVYASVANFAPEDEEGHGRFVPLLNSEDDKDSVASWILINNKSVTIPAGKEAQIPFTLHVPENAGPGGHYGAVLISTQPSAASVQGSQVSVSSAISSLFLVRVSGDVKEEGSIREFSTEKSFYQKPEVNFSVRFENTGNVHLRPQGDITIYNMWGQEKQKFAINQGSEYGNVLPKSVRHFSFPWKGEMGIGEVGRYTAVVTLVYGSQERESVTRTLSFWVIPIVPTLELLAILLLIVLIVRWMIRAYVRRMLGAEEERHISSSSYKPPVVEHYDEALDLRAQRAKKGKR